MQRSREQNRGNGHASSRPGFTVAVFTVAMRVRGPGSSPVHSDVSEGGGPELMKCVIGSDEGGGPVLMKN